LKATTKVAKSGKKKLTTRGLETLSEIVFSKAEQLKVVTKRSKTDYHISHASSSGANEGTGCFDPRVTTPSHVEFSNDEAYNEVTQGGNNEEENLDEEQTNEEEEVNELYMDVNINLEGRDTEMTDAPQTHVQATQVIEDTHVIIIAVTPVF
nr:hypothetical protein [Tanacetum cinerariifolium]